MKKPCPVCLTPGGGNLCRLCWESYRRGAFDTGTIQDVVEWAARRARRFERQRMNAKLRRARAARKG